MWQNDKKINVKCYLQLSFQYRNQRKHSLNDRKTSLSRKANHILAFIGSRVRQLSHCLSLEDCKQNHCFTQMLEWSEVIWIKLNVIVLSIQYFRTYLQLRQVLISTDRIFCGSVAKTAIQVYRVYRRSSVKSRYSLHHFLTPNWLLQQNLSASSLIVASEQAVHIRSVASPSQRSSSRSWRSKFLDLMRAGEANRPLTPIHINKMSANRDIFG